MRPEANLRIPERLRAVDEIYLARVCVHRELVDAEVVEQDPAATLDDLREAATTLEELETIARRVLGGAHPITGNIADELRSARAALRARETPPASQD